MAATTTLTSAPDADAFRALARSSPWRWRTLRFVRHETGPVADRRRAPVRAWLRRPDRLRVEDLDGGLRLVEQQVPYAGAWPMPDGRLVGDGPVSRPDEGGRTLLRATPPDGPVRPRGAALASGPPPGRAQDGELGAAVLVPGDQQRWSHGDTALPPWRDDGLVAHRSPHAADHDAPMFNSYLWVAMLDPVELAEGEDDEGVVAVPADLTDVVEVVHHGRRAWQAELVATAAYQPRCSCCPLLLHTDTDLPPPAGVVLADSHVVRLDVDTGVCVSVLQLGGTHHGWELDVEIEAVDEPMSDELFMANERRPRPRG